MADQLQKDINIVSCFLAKRDIPELSAQALLNFAGIRQTDVLFALGCEVIPVIKCAANAAKRGLCKYIVFSGGIGHSTQNLVHTAKTLYGEHCADMPEAEIMALLAINHFGVDPSMVITEGSSTNTGENIMFSLKILKKHDIPVTSALLMQDPFMQLRSAMTFKKYSPATVLISYAPFIPYAGMPCGSVNGLWSRERFSEFLIREIPRLRDDENGYGPNGAGFISHIDIPAEVEESYARLCHAFE